MRAKELLLKLEGLDIAKQTSTTLKDSEQLSMFISREKNEIISILCGLTLML